MVYSGGRRMVWNHGTAIGTGAQQEILHGLSVTPTVVVLSEYDTGAAIPYQSAAADKTNIYVLATVATTFTWLAGVEEYEG
jgi:hypothetical protein